MVIKLNNAINILSKDIDDFETKIGMSLPLAYKNFLISFNGATPEQNDYKNIGICGVNKFIPLSEIINCKKNIDHVSKFVYPIAFAEGGNYVIINLKEKGSIYFWDHEQPQSKNKLSDNIDEFLLNLQPFDTTKVQLKEGQLISSWIDPVFQNDPEFLNCLINKYKKKE